MTTPKIAIEIKEGQIVYIVSNIKDVVITIIDHDWNHDEENAPAIKTKHKVDSILTDEDFKAFIKNA